MQPPNRSGLKTPLIAGVAQAVQPRGLAAPADPVAMMADVGRRALADAGSSRIPPIIDAVYVVNSFSCICREAPERLSRALALHPAEKVYGPIGGNTPQMLINRICRNIAAGRHRAVLLAGAEAVYSLQRLARGENGFHWPENPVAGWIAEGRLKPDFESLLQAACEEEKAALKQTARPYKNPLNEAEAACDLFLPQYMYPFFETALRSAAGRGVQAHAERMGRLCEHLSSIAASNPYAWPRRPGRGGAKASPGPQNPYIAYPYTRDTVANINVDQAAALVLVSEDVAESAGVRPEKRVFPRGGVDLENIWHVSRRPNLADSPVIGECVRLALEQAGISLDEVGAFDLYSCFPCAVEMACRQMGLSDDDPRALSITGGLPYFGGPGSNYVTHAVATAVENIRWEKNLNILITANGWYNTKYAAGVYGARPPKYPWTEVSLDGVQRAIKAEALGQPVSRATGDLTVEGYMVRHDAAGKPESGVVMGRLKDGRRAVAQIEADERQFSEMEKKELVGVTGKARYDMKIGKNRVSFPSL